MTEQDQIKAFNKDINCVIERYRIEFDLSYASAIGTLVIRAISLSNEALRLEEPEDAE